MHNFFHNAEFYYQNHSFSDDHPNLSFFSFSELFWGLSGSPNDHKRYYKGFFLPARHQNLSIYPYRYADMVKRSMKEKSDCWLLQEGCKRELIDFDKVWKERWGDFACISFAFIAIFRAKILTIFCCSMTKNVFFIEFFILFWLIFCSLLKLGGKNMICFWK